MENFNDNFQEENFLSQWDKKNSFGLPEGYFDLLSARIMNKIEQEQELAEFKTLAQNKQSKFAVPQDYFANLTDRIESKHEASVFSTLNKLAKPTLKKLPADYFETLDKKVQDKMDLENELKEFSTLSSIPKKNNFKTAPDYFESKTEDVKEQIHAEKYKKGIVRQLIAVVLRPQMAIAASLVLIIGISALWYFNKQNPAINGDCMTLACLEKNEILNEKTIQDFDEENLYEMVDVEALDQQLSGEVKLEDSLKTNKE